MYVLFLITLVLWSEDSFCDFYPLRFIETWFMARRRLLLESTSNKSSHPTDTEHGTDLWCHKFWLAVMLSCVLVVFVFMRVCTCECVYTCVPWLWVCMSIYVAEDGWLSSSGIVALFLFFLLFLPKVLCVVSPPPRSFFHIPLWWLWVSLSEAFSIIRVLTLSPWSGSFFV